MGCAEPRTGIVKQDAPEEPMSLPDERAEFIHVRGLRLFCRQWGPAAAIPVVLLHGLRGFSGTWRDVASALSGQFRLIALDQRGRGESDWDLAANYYTDAYLADLEAIVDELGLRRFALVGHSMGGTTSYVYADRHPERVGLLVIEDMAPGASNAGAGAERIKAEMALLPESFASWSEARAYWRSRRPTVSDAAIEQRLAESLKPLANGRIGWRYDAGGIRKTRMNPDPQRVVDLWPVIARLRMPTLIIRGEHSDFCPAESVAEMRRRNPLIDSVTVAGAGHYVHDEQPTAFITQLQRSLVSWRTRELSRSPRAQNTVGE